MPSYESFDIDEGDINASEPMSWDNGMGEVGRYSQPPIPKSGYLQSKSVSASPVPQSPFNRVRKTPSRSAKSTPKYSELDDDMDGPVDDSVDDQTYGYNMYDEASDEGQDFGELEGYADLDDNNSVPEDDDDDEYYPDNNLDNNPDNASDDLDFSNLSPAPNTGAKAKAPAFYAKTTKAAQRAALRTQAAQSDAFLLIEDGSGDVTQTPTRAPGTFGRFRVKKTANASKNVIQTHKKVTGGALDSDDELIMNMRDKGFNDAQIADRLQREGRLRYDRKSISSRIMRIKLAQAAHVDYLLEEGYKEWQLEDDQLLMQAYEYANNEVNYEIEKARAWRFRKVSEWMRRLDRDAIFSENAVRARYNALMTGTARIPTEEDDDPDARRQEMEEYRMAREIQRAAETNEQEAKAALQRKIKDESRFRNAQKAQATAMRRMKKQEEQAQKAMKRAADHQMKLQKAQANKDAKMQRLEQLRREKKAEKEAETAGVRAQNRNAPVASMQHVALKAVTRDTPDPRSFLAVEDLKHLCRERGLPVDDARGVPDMVKRLRDADDVRSAAELKKICRAKGLNTASNKLQQKYQLALAEAQKYASFQANAVAGQGQAGGEEQGGEDQAGIDENEVDLMLG